MNPIEKILIPSLIIIGFLMLIFIGIKVFSINSTIRTAIGEEFKNYKGIVQINEK